MTSFGEAIVLLAEYLLGRWDLNACTVFLKWYLKLLLGSQVLVHYKQRPVRQSLVSVLAHNNILGDLLESSIKGRHLPDPTCSCLNPTFQKYWKEPFPSLLFPFSNSSARLTTDATHYGSGSTYSSLLPLLPPLGALSLSLSTFFKTAWPQDAPVLVPSWGEPKEPGAALAGGGLQLFCLWVGGNLKTIGPWVQAKIFNLTLPVAKPICWSTSGFCVCVSLIHSQTSKVIVDLIFLKMKDI